jgi:hypothetical protein
MDVPLGYRKYLQKEQAVNTDYPNVGFRDKPPMAKILVDEAKKVVPKALNQIEEIYMRLVRIHTTLNNRFDAILGVIFSVIVIFGMASYYEFSHRSREDITDLMPSSIFYLVVGISLMATATYAVVNVMDILKKKQAVFDVHKQMKKLADVKVFLENESDRLYQSYRGLDGQKEVWSRLNVTKEEREVTKCINESEALSKLVAIEHERKDGGLVSITHYVNGIGMGVVMILSSWVVVDQVASMQQWYNGNWMLFIFLIHCGLPIYMLAIFRRYFFGRAKMSRLACYFGETLALPVLLLLLYLSTAIVIVFVGLAFIVVAGIVATMRWRGRIGRILLQWMRW